MTLDLIFASNFYTKFTAPNSDEIMDAVNLHVQLDNFDDYKFEWGKDAMLIEYF